MATTVTINANIEKFTGDATMVFISSVGFPVCIHVKVQEAKLKPDWSSKNYIQVTYVERGKRKVKSAYFRDQEIAIAKGWQQVSGAMNGSKEGEFTCFEDGVFQKMLDQVTDVIYLQQD